MNLARETCEKTPTTEKNWCSNICKSSRLSLKTVASFAVPAHRPFSRRFAFFAGDPLAPRRAFTLVEILVATAIFLFLMVILVSVVAAISESWTAGRALAETQMRSRAILDLIGRDLRSRVARPTLPAFDGGKLRFYTLQAGSSGAASTNRRLTFVDYNLAGTNSALRRDETEFKDWAASPASVPLGASNTPNLATSNHIIAEGIPGFAYAYLLTNGTYTTNVSATNSPIGLRVSLAVLDEPALDQLRVINLENALLDVLQAPIPGTNSPAALWKSALDTAEWKVAGQTLPPKVRRGLRFFERTYSLGNP